MGLSAPLVTRIAALSEVDGRLLVEIPLGRADGIEAWTLLRVHDPQKPSLSKGLVQVLAVAEAHRSVARVVAGPFDPQTPFAVDDLLREVRELDTGSATLSLARPATQATPLAQRPDDARFDALRENYQLELDALAERQRREMEHLRQTQTQSLQQTAAERERERSRLAAAHEAELAALRGTLAEQSAAEQLAQRRAFEAELVRIETARAAVEARIAGLAGERERLDASLAQTRADADAAAERHSRELLAEVETREVLQRRIRELESRLGVPGVDRTAVLVNDAGRRETVLAQLDRALRERDAARAEVERLRSGAGGPDAVGAENARLQEALAQARVQAAEEAVVRMAAERGYFSLAAQVLRLPAHVPSAAALQEALRRDLAALGLGDPHASATQAQPEQPR
jgi:hypothetical protein